jgi:hypothetical protein
VEVKEWIGDLNHFSELSEVWIQLDEIPSKWYDWKIFLHKWLHDLGCYWKWIGRRCLSPFMKK